MGSIINLETLVNDFSGAVPGLADSMDQTNRINYIYNRFLNMANNTQIIPMIGIGFSYFQFFPVIFSCLNMWLMMTFDFKFSITAEIEIKYVYRIMGLYFAMSMGLNTQSIWAIL